MQEIFVLKLRKPLKIDSGEITELNLREPTAGELDFSETNSTTANGRTIQLIALVSGKHKDVIKSLGARDYRDAGKYIASFLEDSPEAGNPILPT